MLKLFAVVIAESDLHRKFQLFFTLLYYLYSFITILMIITRTEIAHFVCIRAREMAYFTLCVSYKRT